MRTPGAEFAVYDFVIPPGSPKPVAAVYERFRELVARVRTAQAEVKTARQGIVDAKAADIRAVADAAAVGEEIADPEKNVKAAQVKLGQAMARKEGLDVAADEAGNELARVIAEHRDEWLASIDEPTATERYAETIAAAREAAEQLALVRGAAVWLESFDADEASVGGQSQYAGGRLVVKPHRKPEINVVEVLELAASAAEPPAVRVARKASPAESRFSHV